MANVVEVVIQWAELRDSGYFGSVARDQWFHEQLQKVGVPMRRTAKGTAPDYSKGFLDVFYDDNPAQITMRWTAGFTRPQCPVLSRKRVGFGETRLTVEEREALAW